MRKITAALLFLTAALLYAADRIGWHMTHIALSSMGYSADIGSIDSILTIILAVIFAALGIYMLVTSRKES